MFCFPDVYSYGSRVMHDLHIIKHYTARGSAVHILEVYLWIMRQFAYLAAHLGSRSFVHRDANKTETVLFTMFFAFLFYGHYAEECNMTWPIAHDTNRWTFWTSCTGVSWKRPFLSIMLIFGYSWLTDMRILVGRVLETGRKLH